MKTKKIITATILSTGLILGTTSAAYAVDPAPSANLTVASYSSQLAAFNLASAAFGDATVAFRAQVLANATALAAYKVSYAALQQAYQAAVVANSPVTTAVRYSNLVAAYNVASTAYHSSARLFSSQSNTYQTAVQSYEKAYRAAIDSYKLAIASFGQVNATIYLNFENSLKKANSIFAVSLRASKTSAQKSRAMNIRTKAVLAAIATRSAARTALGAAPMKPVQQIQINQKVDAFQAVRLVFPVKTV